MPTMKPTATTPWLLALAVAMLPRNSCALERIRPLQSPLPSSYARPRLSAFVHRTNDRINPSLVAKNSKCNPSSKTSPPLSEKYGPTRICMSSSPASSSRQRTSPSPWSPGKWKITLDFGRDRPEPLASNDNLQLSNVLGEEWGFNGGRLVLSLEVMVTAEANKREDENSVQSVWLGGKPTGTVECIPQKTSSDEDYCASYINDEGQQNVKISSGQWRIEPPLPLLPTYVNVLPGQASTLRFHLTLLTPVRRNAISFPRDQILLLQSNTFRTRQYSSGARTLLPYQYAKDASQRQLEEQLNHETGDRRLDGNDIFETLGGYKDVAEMVLERDEKRRRWKEVEGALPILDSSAYAGRRTDVNELLEDEKRWGIWPGDTEFMTVERGVVLAAVVKESKQNTGFFPWMRDGGGLEEPVVVGKWRALPM